MARDSRRYPRSRAQTSRPDAPASQPLGKRPRRSRRYKVAMLAACPFPTAQGTQVAIRHLAAELSRAEHEIHLITYGYGDALVLDRLAADTAPFHIHRTLRIDVGTRSGPSLRKPLADAALFALALRVCQTHGCELIHAHNIEGLAAGILLKRVTRLPLVYHAHNAMGPELPTYFSGRLAQALAAVAGGLIDRGLPRLADAVVVFDHEQKALLASHGVQADRLHVIPPGLAAGELQSVDPDAKARLERELGRGPWLLYAGNPDGYQNLGLMWRALQIVRRQRPDARLLVASPCGYAEFAKEIAGLGEQVDLTAVVFARPQSRAELAALHAVAQVGLCPRALDVGAPIKVLNYLAAGLPVVACRSGARHLLPPGAGWLVDNHPEAFAAAILAALEGVAPGRGGKPETAAPRVTSRFSIETQLALYEAAYGRALEPRCPQ